MQINMEQAEATSCIVDAMIIPQAAWAILGAAYGSGKKVFKSI